MKKHIGELIAEIAKSEKISQSNLSDKTGISYPQLNKFFNGKSNLSLENFLLLLKALNIDIYSSLLSRRNKTDSEIESVEDCVLYLYRNLDTYGQQTYLRQLEWTNKVLNKKLPMGLTSIIEKNVNLI